MKQKEYIEDLRTGAGSLKYYNYYVTGLKINSKKGVLEAIQLKIKKIGRVDKITKKFEYYNYKEKRFI